MKKICDNMECNKMELPRTHIDDPTK